MNPSIRTRMLRLALMGYLLVLETIAASKWLPWALVEHAKTKLGYRGFGVAFYPAEHRRAIAEADWDTFWQSRRSGAPA